MIKFLYFLVLGFLPLVVFSQTERKDTRSEDAAITKAKVLNIEVLDEVKYPLKAVTKKISGTVKVEIEVDEEGNYQAHNIVQSPDPVLTEAVDQYISGLKFRPAMQGEENITSVTEISFIFSIIKRLPVKTDIRIIF